MESLKKKLKRKKRRQTRIRKKVNGTCERPRLCVYRSSKHIYCQLIDDFEGKTIASSSSLVKEIREKFPYGGNKDVADAVGQKIADEAIKIGIKDIVFDRSGYKFHGRVKSLAEAVRKKGLNF